MKTEASLRASWALGSLARAANQLDKTAAALPYAHDVALKEAVLKAREKASESAEWTRRVLVLLEGVEKLLPKVES